MGVGLRIDTRISWRGWSLTWRLLSITMPLTILAGVWLGYGLATAILLGAVPAPTDPVLAGDVQLVAPGKGGEEPVRFALAAEDGFNDGVPPPHSWLCFGVAWDA